MESGTLVGLKSVRDELCDDDYGTHFHEGIRKGHGLRNGTALKEHNVSNRTW